MPDANLLVRVIKFKLGFRLANLPTYIYYNCLQSICSRETITIRDNLKFPIHYNSACFEGKRLLAAIALNPTYRLSYSLQKFIRYPESYNRH